jgi:protein-tyrosine phosphatase
MDCDFVTDRIIVGEFPAQAYDARWLSQRMGVTAVLNLQTDDDLDGLGVDQERLEQGYRDEGVELRRVEIRDFDTEDLVRHLPRAVTALRELLEAGHTVYLHCTAGAGRSPSVAAAYLHWVGGMGLVEAERFVRSRRACTPDLEAIERAGPA